MTPTTAYHDNRHHNRLSNPIPSLQEPMAEGGRVHGVLRLWSGATVYELRGPIWANNRTRSHDQWPPTASTGIDHASFHLDHIGLLGIPQHELLDELKSKHPTLEPTQHVTLATGVPPHIDHFITLRKVFDLCTKTDLKLDSNSKTLRGSIFNVIDQKVGSELLINRVEDASP